MVDDLGLIQLDSVNVIDRTQHLVMYSRLGPHRREILRDAVDDGELVEGWIHEASVLPAEDHHLFHWRRKSTEDLDEVNPRTASWVREHTELIDDIRRQVTERGPVTVSDLDQPVERRGPWWGWDDSKYALEWLFRTGEFGATRGPNFERRYDLIERILPPGASTAATPRPDALRELVKKATGHLGIGTDADIADYHRVKVTEIRPLLRDLVDDGQLTIHEVEGWDRPGYMVAGTPAARATSNSTLVSPFDPVVWCRARALRMFDFHYRIEIYVPAPKRVYGYYVLPFVHRDGIRARVDLKTDRADRRLLVKATWSEDTDDDPVDTADALGRELTQLARHVGAETVVVDDRGSLAGALIAAHGQQWAA